VVQKIGGPLGPDDMFRLQDLLRHRDPAVCRKAEQVILSMSPGGVPKTDAELAMARTLNPFLTIPPRHLPRRRTPGPAATLRSELKASWRHVKANLTRRRREEREQAKRS
jgi:hypothetical protein